MLERNWKSSRLVSSGNRLAFCNDTLAEPFERITVSHTETRFLNLSYSEFSRQQLNLWHVRKEGWMKLTKVEYTTLMGTHLNYRKTTVG